MPSSVKGTLRAILIHPMKTMKRSLLILFSVLLLLAGLILLWPKETDRTVPEPPTPSPGTDYSGVTDFTECVDAGLPVMESYPRQCATPDGRSFTEDIGNMFEKAGLIFVDSLSPNDAVTSPLTVTGEARGYWYFEASFPVRLFDADGNELAVVPAQALDEWMTEEFVPFEVELVFTPPATPTGTLRLERDNPSGLPENDDALIIPVVF